jgi:hypothetical protein
MNASFQLCLAILLGILCLASSWSTSFRISSKPSNQRGIFGGARALALSAGIEPTSESGIRLDAVASSGLDDAELFVVLQAVQEAITNGVGLEVSCGTSSLIVTESPCPSSITGALGRVLMLQTNLDGDSIEVVQNSIAEQMDHLLYSEPPALVQPVLITVKNSILEPLSVADEQAAQQVLTSILEEEVEQYEMAKAVVSKHPSKDSAFVPTIRVELDAAQTIDAFSSTTWWDTSSVLVFDDLVDEELRKGLLDVTLGRCKNNEPADDWDDVASGPNPKRWVRGGLLDIPDENDQEEAASDEEFGPCWGLRNEAIEEVCFEQHGAIEKFEGILSNLFPQYVVTRLPEAVFGASVSPLSANAPTAGDEFNYHIDGDPNLTPPSPWTDVYGRYPNRLRGKPRFMSCLLYLSDEWDEDWGAPTRFLDTPTDEAYDVLPRPGRCVLMDQDCSHTVVAPNPSAGKRPRYSLVWKLVLHPKTDGQDMTDLVGDRRKWPDPLLFGSANQDLGQ